MAARPYLLPRLHLRKLHNELCLKRAVVPALYLGKRVGLVHLLQLRPLHLRPQFGESVEQTAVLADFAQHRQPRAVVDLVDVPSGDGLQHHNGLPAVFRRRWCGAYACPRATTLLRPPFCGLATAAAPAAAVAPPDLGLARGRRHR